LDTQGRLAFAPVGFEIRPFLVQIAGSAGFFAPARQRDPALDGWAGIGVDGSGATHNPIQRKPRSIAA
jgi:hypothetical protein